MCSQDVRCGGEHFIFTSEADDLFYSSSSIYRLLCYSPKFAIPTLPRPIKNLNIWLLALPGGALTTYTSTLSPILFSFRPGWLHLHRLHPLTMPMWLQDVDTKLNNSNIHNFDTSGSASVTKILNSESLC